MLGLLTGRWSVMVACLLALARAASADHGAWHVVAQAESAPATAPAGVSGPSPSELTTPPPATVPSIGLPKLVFPGDPGIVPAATFSLRYSVRLTEEYSDNFNQSDSAKQQNFRTVLAPGVTLLINAARTKGQIGLELAGTKDSSDDNVELFASLRGQVSWNPTPRLSLTASDVLTRSDDVSLADELNLRRERSTFTSNIFSVGANYLIGDFATSASYQLSTFFDEDGVNTVSQSVALGVSRPFLQFYSGRLGYDFLTSDTSEGGADVTAGHQWSASVSRQLGAFAAVGLSGSYGLRYVDDGDATSTAGGDYAIASVSLFGRYNLPGILSASASIGYSAAFPDRGSHEGSITTSTSISYRFGLLVATVTADAGFSETFITGENFGLVQTKGVRASLSYPVTPLVSAAISGGYRENQPTGGQDSGATEDTWTAGASLSYRILRWLTLSLEYTYIKANSSNPNEEYTENRARASLSASF